MIRWKYFLTAMVAAALFVGCSHHTYEQSQSKDYDFSRLKTVAILHPTIDDPRTRNAQKLFDEAIKEEMARKGYTPTTKERADFYIVYHLGVTDTRTLSNDYRVIGITPTFFGPRYGHYGYRYVIAPSTASYESSDGKIIAEAIDPKRDNLVFWNAKMSDRLQTFKNEAERKAFIKRVVRKLFSRFPDRSGS